MSKLIRPHPQVVEIYAAVFAEGLKITQVLDRAGVNGSTWTAYRKGVAPLVTTIDRLRAALRELVAEDQGTPEDGPQGRQEAD